MLKSKINIKKLHDRLLSNKLPLIANEIITDIIDRTQKGLDVNNNSFKDYTPDYKKSKGKKFGSGTVNLTRKQTMLNAITWKEIPDGIRLYFNSKEQNDKAHGNQVKNGREFLGVDPIMKNVILKKLQKLMV